MLTAALLASPAGSGGQTATIRVRNEEQFAAAAAALADSGGRIVLLPHLYRGELIVSSRPVRPLEIVGRPGVRVSGILLEGARRVSLGGFTLAPVGADAAIDVVASDHLDLHDLVVTAEGTHRSASISLDDSRNVAIRDSEFTHCGDFSPAWVDCVRLKRSSDRVSVVNNVFLASDRVVPGYRPRVDLIVGSSGRRNWCHSVRGASACIPRDVRVVGNTILTGARRTDGYLGSIRMSSRYGGLAHGDRPILANNVIGVLDAPGYVCSEARVSVSNVVLRGHACSRSDRVGPAHLDGHGRPTAASTLLIDRATRCYAPTVDFTGHSRGARPDIGAFEYRGPTRSRR